MSKIDDLATRLTALRQMLSEPDDAAQNTEFNHFLIAAVLRIWAANKQYSESYAQALRVFDGTVYSAAQIVTALDCAGDPTRKLAIPEFFQAIVLQDKAKYETKSRDLVEAIGLLLAEFALINGDFTIEEAAILKQIMDQLNAYCDHCEIGAGKPLAYRPEMITKLSQTGYYLTPEKENTPEQQKPSAEGSAPIASDKPRSSNSKSNNTKDQNSGLNLNLSSDDQTKKGENLGVSVNRHDDSDAAEDTLESVLAELNSLVGLEKVKLDVQSLLNFIRICKIRTERGMKVPTISYHLVFTGNPGTGKTTVARMVAKLYYLLGILPSGQLVETDRSGLVAGYLGQTAIKTQKVIQEALGGVLFIDEAYALANDKEDSYGKEAIETLLKAMEDHRDELVVIVAGYDNLMHKFIDSNPGLRSRFNKYFHFPDYDGEELLRILERFCDTNGYVLAQDTQPYLQKKLNELYEKREEHFGNARAIRNLFEHAINLQATRLVEDADLTNEELATLTPEDILPAMEVI